MTQLSNNSYNETFMQRAIELSELAYTSGKGLPIGCVVVKDGKIIGEGHNEIFSRTNPTAHAEMVAIEDACQKTGSLLLEGCDLYTTLEPCPMCLGAIYWAKLNVVYFANTSKDALESGFSDLFIAEEIGKAPEKRRIPMLVMKNSAAIKVLKDWQAKGSTASQPWHQSKDSR